ncbi:MAG TPA: radical SAM protein [Desulfobacteraceae bacterium]|nr:MAG: radical SAM protein [Deltaproteobacteria bacterium]HDZ23940.1 radical SAM protein [Desulfobacteraceae bacterium]
MGKKYRYLFGPVPSRRFGRSLGVDLSKPKTCSLDCVFCQLGRTGTSSIERKEYVPTGEVIAELKDWLETDGQADYITLSGSGEPTLHSGFGEVLAFVRENSSIPALLLTNGTMLYLPEVREGASHASIVKTSLSAWDEASYALVNRPHPELRFDLLVEGEKAFRADYTGKLFLEVFLIKGMNARPEEVKKIAALAKEIAPDRVQLNTAVRPPAEKYAVPLTREEMEGLAELFKPKAEIIAEFKARHGSHFEANQDAILAMLKRRPCTAEQLAEVFGMHLNELSKYLGKLTGNQQVLLEQRNGLTYYTVPSRERRSNA